MNNIVIQKAIEDLPTETKNTFWSIKDDCVILPTYLEQAKEMLRDKDYIYLTGTLSNSGDSLKELSSVGKSLDEINTYMHNFRYYTWKNKNAAIVSAFEGDKSVMSAYLSYYVWCMCKQNLLKIPDWLFSDAYRAPTMCKLTPASNIKDADPMALYFNLCANEKIFDRV